MSIFKRRGVTEGVTEKDMKDLVDKLEAAPPSPFLHPEPSVCSYCGKETQAYILKIKIQSEVAGMFDGRTVCYDCGLRLLDALVHLLTGQSRKEEQ